MSTLNACKKVKVDLMCITNGKQLTLPRHVTLELDNAKLIATRI